MRTSQKVVILNSGGFSPTQFPSLKFWVDRSAGDVLFQDVSGAAPADTGDVAARWNDLSTQQNYVTNGAPANRPTVQAGGVSFNNSHALAGQSSLSVTNRTVFAAVRFDASLEWDIFFNIGSSGQFYVGKHTSGKMGVSYRNSLDVQVFSAGATLIPVGATAIVSHRLSVSGSNVNVIGRIDGVGEIDASATSGLTVANAVPILGGISTTGGLGLGGDISELFFCDAALTDSEIEQGEDYLTRKWA